MGEEGLPTFPTTLQRYEVLLQYSEVRHTRGICRVLWGVEPKTRQGDVFSGQNIDRLICENKQRLVHFRRTVTNAERHITPNAWRFHQGSFIKPRRSFDRGHRILLQFLITCFLDELPRDFSKRQKHQLSAFLCEWRSREQRSSLFQSGLNYDIFASGGETKANPLYSSA